VAEVKFTGQAVIPSAALRNAINGVAIGTIFNETRFRQLLATTIKPLYEERGRLRVTFPKVTVERSKEVNGLNVMVTVDEGESFNLGDIRMQGRNLPEAELMRAADFKMGDLANMTAVNEGVERMRNVLRRLGYIGAVATPDRLVNDQNKVVDLVIDIDPGDQFMMRALKVQGLDIESEPVIRKMWGLKEGKPFNPEYPDVFLNRVRVDQVFEELGEARSALTIDRAAKAVDVTLLFGRAAKAKSILKSAPRP
jgi:outer membrane protein assembly factor BamA